MARDKQANEAYVKAIQSFLRNAERQVRHSHPRRPADGQGRNRQMIAGVSATSSQWT